MANSFGSPQFDIGIDFFSKMSDDEEDSFDMFATERHITAVECPIFIVHGHKVRSSEKHMTATSVASRK